MMKLTPSFSFLGLWESTVRPTYATGTSAIFSLNYSNIFSLSRKGVVRVQYLPYEIRKNPTNHCLQPIPLNQDGWIDVCGQTDTMCLKHWPQHKGANGKKTAISLDWENNNFARASPFFAHFFAVIARPRRVKVMLGKTIRNEDF